ncbi:MAG: helix-turn-helix domain-containing protein [Sphingomonadales bacterium]|jgi:transcriptional regulator with XRE-family HTH domain|nr:helix-turn-helix domain-containing protein [Sphingomonadales bacterium]
MKWSKSLSFTLKTALKAQGWNTRLLAETLNVGEATAKRWLAGKGLTVDRLEQLCALANLSLSDLADRSEGQDTKLAQELTLAQERALSRDALLAFLFIIILGGTPVSEVEQDFALTPEMTEAALQQLDRLALIDRFRDGRIRPRVDRAILWRKTPMRAMFEERMKAQFLAMDFADPQAVYASEVIKLSAVGAAQLAELIEQQRREIQNLAERDRREMRLNRQWYALLSAMRLLDTTGLETEGRSTD